MRKSTSLIACALVLTAGLMTSSCRKDSVPAPGGPELEEVGAIKLPDGVVAFGSVKSLTDITTAATDIGSAFNKGLGPLVGGQVSALVQARLIGTRNLTWMDPTAPMRVVVMDPARFPAPFVFIGTVAYEDGLKEAIEEPSSGVEGNKTAYKGKNGRTMYLNRIGKLAIFSMEPSAFGAVEDFLRSDLLRHPATKLVDCQASAAGFKSVVKPLVDARLAAANTETPTAMDLVASELSDLLEFVDQTSALRLTMSFVDGDLKLEGSALPIEGSTAARFAADAAGRKLVTFRKFMTEGWLEFTSNVNPELFKGLSIKGLESASAFLPFNQQEKDEFEALVARNLATQSGDMAFQIGYEKQFPFRIAEVVELSDAVAAREAVGKLNAILLAKFGVLVNAALPGAAGGAAPGAVKPATIDFSSVQAAIDTSKEMLGAQGVVASLRTVSADGLDVDSLEFTLDPARLNPADAELARFREVLGDRLSGGIGFDKGAMYLAFGLNSVDDISRMRASDGKGSTKLARVIEAAGFDVSMAGRVSLVDAAKIAANVAKGVLSQLPSLNTISQRPDLSMAVGSRGNRIVAGYLTIPVAGIAALMQPPSATPNDNPSTP